MKWCHERICGLARCELRFGDETASFREGTGSRSRSVDRESEMWALVSKNGLAWCVTEWRMVKWRGPRADNRDPGFSIRDELDFFAVLLEEEAALKVPVSRSQLTELKANRSGSKVYPRDSNESNQEHQIQGIFNEEISQEKEINSNRYKNEKFSNLIHLDP